MMANFCVNGEDYPDKGFRNRCVTRLKAAMQQNPENTLVRQFGCDPFKAEEYYFDKASGSKDGRAYYMSAITRALKHFKGPGPPMHPLPQSMPPIPTTAKAEIVEPVVVNQIQLRSGTRTSTSSNSSSNTWPSQAYRNNSTSKLKTEMAKDEEKVTRLGYPPDAKQIEAIVFQLCDGKEEHYKKMMGQLTSSIVSPSAPADSTSAVTDAKD